MKKTEIAAATLCLLLTPAIADAEMYHVRSGTGFFVNRDHIITNAHVVGPCTQVVIKGAVAERTANVTATDADHDLALIETDAEPRQFAPLRMDIDAMRAGDKVIIAGYPGEDGAKGIFKISDAEVTTIAHDDVGKPGQFFITDVVEHGDSGGPVFDASGNVIGVVVAKSVLTLSDAATRAVVSEQHLGVVISLATLKDFLMNHGVYTQWQSSSLQASDSAITDNAKDYIVNVQCRVPVE